MVLIGMMGSGKTSVGRELAGLLGCPWTDLDVALERRYRRSVARQFETAGEALFRRRESGLLRELAAASTGVLSAGGGVVLAEANRALLKRLATVYLQVSPRALAARLQGPQARLRPLLRGGDPETVLRRMAALRSPLYRSCAAITVRASQGTPAEVARRVCRRLDRAT